MKNESVNVTDNRRWLLSRGRRVAEVEEEGQARKEAIKEEKKDGK